MTDRPSQARALPVPSGRIARFARLGSMAGGIAGNAALGGLRELGRGSRPEWRNLVITPANLRRLTEELAHMRGAAMKVGQLLSMDTGEILPPELSGIMARLRDDAHFMPPRQLKQVLTAEWGPDWLRGFERFDVRPVAAASIGQVHRARLRDGRDLAIKVQYPGVARSIDSDVANVGALVRLSGLLPKGFELRPYLDEARRQLHEETDYAREGTCLQDFRARLADDPRFVVPEFHPDWSTPQVLAMTFIEGHPVESTAEAPPETRNRIAGDLIGLMFRELFEWGIMQSDPNFANYRIEKDSGKVVLLDFGATRPLDAGLIGAYRRLLSAGLRGDAPGIRQAATEIGFLDPGGEPDHQARIGRMIDMVFEALNAPGEFDFTDSAMSQRMQAEGMALAEAGYVPPLLPMDVLYLQRKFGGILLLGSRLGARLPLREMLEPYVDGA